MMVFYKKNTLIIYGYMVIWHTSQLLLILNITIAIMFSFNFIPCQKYSFSLIFILHYSFSPMPVHVYSPLPDSITMKLVIGTLHDPKSSCTKGQFGTGTIRAIHPTHEIMHSRIGTIK